MTVDNEDRRAAASLVASLSSYVITATLAVLGAQAVIVTFALDTRSGLRLFYVASGAGVALLVASILVGGAGIYEIASRGRNGDWSIRTRRRKFNLQAILALAGLAAVLVSAFLGSPKEDQGARAAAGAVTTRIQAVERQVHTLARHDARVARQIRRLRRHIASIENPNPG